MDPSPTNDHPGRQPLSRRRLFELTGAGVTVGALLSACGKKDRPAPGRVGSAPSTTALPTLAITNAVYLRTMSSIEHAIIEVYTKLGTIDSLDAAIAAAISRFTDDHTNAAAHLAELTTAAGGDTYECANPWWLDRLVQPSLDAVFGAGDTPPSEDPARDAINFVDVLEKVSAASYQHLVGQFSDPSLRGEGITLGAAASRRSATITLLAAPAPGTLVSPALLGGTVDKDEAGFTPKFAIDSRFGQLVPFELQVGAPNDLGVRFKVNYETPADNAFIYEDMRCAAPEAEASSATSVPPVGAPDSAPSHSTASSPTA